MNMNIINQQILASAGIIVIDSRNSDDHGEWHFRLYIESQAGDHVWAGEVEFDSDNGDEVCRIILDPMGGDDAFTLSSDTDDESEREIFRRIANAVYSYMDAAGKVEAHYWQKDQEQVAMTDPKTWKT